ncbi:phytosulfokines-like [Abrus precatorius]|uniref:Phytosulfokine n=1 Tax=Abrus precatorius TaxID=3816 RepID=A0A8B8JPX8_ABRPR|nr:phytosulfokines-like [Abrus precatorius]
MSKLATLFTFALLLSFNLIYASRPNPVFNGVSSLHEDVAANKVEIDDESCEEGTEECLTRRTLAAHTDYIYTQKHKPRN